MQKGMRAIAWAAAVLLVSAAAWGALKLQRGDRWPQNAARALAAGDGHLFLGRGHVLTILDDGLGLAAQIDLPGEILGIAYAAGYVYVAAGLQGLFIVDVSTPDAPALVQNPYVPENGAGIGAVVVEGSYAYTLGSAATNLVTVVDVSDPAAPQKMGQASIPGVLVYAVNLQVAGGTAAVADQINGLHLLDVSNAQQPVWKSRTVIEGAADVALAGGFAYVTSPIRGMRIVDVLDPLHPVQHGSLDPEGAAFQGLALSGESAYVADVNGGLLQVNIADPDDPRPVQTYPGTRGAYSVAAAAGGLFVCDTALGLQKIDGGSYRPPAGAGDLFVDGDSYLYLVDGAAATVEGREGLHILDAFNAGNLVFKGFVRTPGKASAVFAAGGHAYVADGGSGLQVIDISDKSAPVIVGSIDTPGSANDVTLSGSFAYVADGADGLKVIDISQPAAPQQAGARSLSGTAYAVCVAGPWVYVAAGEQGLVIVDAADPHNPQTVGALDTQGIACDVVVSGSSAYVADGPAGVAIVDISDPVHPSEVGRYDTAGEATGVHLKEHYLRVADGSGGVLTLDLSDPAAPTPVAAWSASTSGKALKLAAAGEYLFAAEDLGGVAVYRLFDDDPFTPDPFNPQDLGGSCFIETLARPGQPA